MRAINSGRKSWRYGNGSGGGISIPLAANCKSTAKCLKYAKRNPWALRWTLNSSLDRWFKSHLSAETRSEESLDFHCAGSGWLAWVSEIIQIIPEKICAVRIRLWTTTAVGWGRQSKGLSGVLLSPIRIRVPIRLRVCYPRNPPVDNSHEPWAATSLSLSPICCCRWQPTGYPIYYKCLPLAVEHWHLANGKNVTEMQTHRHRRRQANKQLAKGGAWSGLVEGVVRKSQSNNGKQRRTGGKS